MQMEAKLASSTVGRAVTWTSEGQDLHVSKQQKVYIAVSYTMYRVVK